MEVKQGTGRDAGMMIPVLGCLFLAVTELLLPWFSMPVLKYEGLPVTFSVWRIGQCLDAVNQSAGADKKLHMSPLSGAETDMILRGADMLKLLAVCLAVVFVCGAAWGFVKKRESVKMLRVVFGLGALFSVLVSAAGLGANLFLNGRLGRENSFINLTLHSYLQLTAYPYAQLFLCVLMLFFVGRLMDAGERRCMGKRTRVSFVLLLAAVPALIFFGIFFLNDRSDSFISLCIIVLAMLPFYMAFEDRRPQARELLLIAVMAALAVVGRMAFFMLPQFKPITAIVIIAGAGLGAEAGFLTGASAGFVSNFFFGQGPWTPWQMFAFGMIGFFAGLIFCGRGSRLRESRTALCIYGGLASFVLYGLIMDTSSVVTFSGTFSWKTVLSVYAAGIPFNFMHGVSTVVFLFFLAKPMGMKLNRITKKYGILIHFAS